MALALTGTATTAAQAAPSDDVTKKIQKASHDLEKVIESANQLTIDFNKSKSDEQKLKASLGPAKDALTAASADMQKIASNSYRTGNVGPVNVLLDNDGPAGLLEKMSLMEQMTRSRQRQIDNYTTLTQDFATRQTTMHNTQAKAVKQLNELNARKTKIKADLDKLYAMRTDAYGQAVNQGSKYTGAIPNISGSAGQAVSFAYNAIGAGYSSGGVGPSYYDCSGLTMKAWAAAGKSLPHNAAAQRGATASITESQLRPGDLVFYNGNGHVGLFVGGGMIIHASQPGEPVSKTNMYMGGGFNPQSFGRVK